MTKDVNQMNSIEYAEYKMQQNRTWKNQQYDRFRKDQEKQKNEQLVKDLLGLTFGEMKANAEYNLQTMQLNNLNDSIKTVANLASANEIQKEREALLSKYGTAENIWSYQAASRAFNNPEIASLKITSLSDLDKALATGLINPQQHKTYKNSFEVEKNRYKDLWENDKSFDKYNDNFVTTRTAELTALRDTKPTIGAIGLITGKDQDARDLIQNNYNLIFEENSAVAKSLSTRQSILAGNTKTNVSQKEIDNVVAQNILQDDNLQFRNLKGQITPLISKTARIYADSDKIEARFDKLIKEKYENNETFNVTDVWNEATRPFNRNFRYDEIAAVTKYIDTAKQNGADNAVIQAKVKDNFGLDVPKFFFLITVFAIKSNSLPSHFNANGILISVCMSLRTASASGPNCAIFLPYFLYACLNNLVNSEGVICLIFLLSFTRSKKCLVKSTSMPTALNKRSAYLSN